jgi:phenylpyruvate tautomerase PptA (4-oxalocrotonate tautomerase family)
MPMITVKWVEGHNQKRRDKIAAKITEVVSKETGITPPNIWVVFEDVKAEDWYTDATQVAVQRAAAKKAAKKK